MRLPTRLVALALSSVIMTDAATIGQDAAVPVDRATCPDYVKYSMVSHTPLSAGPAQLPFQRPIESCRTFTSPEVEKVIQDVTSRMTDKDLARLFENAFPNTLDTTVRWHTATTVPVDPNRAFKGQGQPWAGAQSFIVTGDINAEWLRDSTNQLLQYQPLANKDPALKTLILGAINTQAEYVIASPYCNSFQPPPGSGLPPTTNDQKDTVTPAYDKSVVFECKYELDSLANFLALGNKYYEETKSLDFLTPRWYSALQNVMQVLDEQAISTFNGETGQYQGNVYTFQRDTTIGTETLSLKGLGNPLNNGTNLIRSAFRPSDDTTIFGYFIPANAMMSVELKRTAAMLRAAGQQAWADNLQARGNAIERGVKEHGIINHKVWGDVYAFEVDGYGSQLIMDDANIPSLLALPILGFLDKSDKVYQNTRRMILNRRGNPYHIEGSQFAGIGGPHIGVHNAWPMSLLVQAMTSDDDTEISQCLQLVLKASKLGLIHESVDVNNITDYSRSWFAWANSVYAQTILDVARRKPEIIFGSGASSYTPGQS